MKTKMNDDIRQKDFSNLSVQDMSLEQRKEMRRRFEEFAQAIHGSKAPGKAEDSQPKKKMVKWMPRTMKKGK